jgi:hypothetical protein
MFRSVLTLHSPDIVLSSHNSWLNWSIVLPGRTRYSSGTAAGNQSDFQVIYRLQITFLLTGMFLSYPVPLILDGS